MKPLQKIAIISNASKDGAEVAGQELKKLAEGQGLEVVITEEFPAPEGFLQGKDACFVIGGDGTLLGLMEQAVEHKVPVAGVRYGQLGFLATFSPDELSLQMPRIFQGEYQIGQRSLLSFMESGGTSQIALNDLVVKSGSSGRLARFTVFAGEEPVADYACDGIVFSTPTGSTAYNLAAGGPVAHPDARVVLMTPISAHTLTSRSVVFPSGVSLRIESGNNPDPPLVSADGQSVFEPNPRFPIEVCAAELTFPLLEELNHSHFRVLKNKLKWD